MTNFIIFPHQLFEDISLLNKYKNIYLIEHPVFFGYREKKLIFNKKKLILHMASMMNYCDYLSKSLKKSINYIKIASIPEKNRGAFDFIKEIDGDIAFYNPVDHFLFHQIETYCQKNKREFEVIETPNFITSEAELRKYYASVKSKKKPFFKRASISGRGTAYIFYRGVNYHMTRKIVSLFRKGLKYQMLFFQRRLTILKGRSQLWRKNSRTIMGHVMAFGVPLHSWMLKSG